ncbi:putative folate-biopterin transporter 3 [Nicotiana attenuata]|uniref:Folate-biopterin transporter 3 n=1 Tax=Nicotiana attenuata TaxID=49451 RepID=A0A314L0L6_NICAT|nr:putative folate-biopterin transporter 3 [Nicotiana attenuata]
MQVKQKKSSCAVQFGDDVLSLVVEPHVDHSLVMALVTVYGLIQQRSIGNVCSILLNLYDKLIVDSTYFDSNIFYFFKLFLVLQLRFLGAFAMLNLSFGHNLQLASALLCLIGGSAAQAVADVTIDACVTENSISHPSLASDMQSLCGVSSSIGQLIGYTISGFLVHLIASKGVPYGKRLRDAREDSRWYLLMPFILLEAPLSGFKETADLLQDLHLDSENKSLQARDSSKQVSSVQYAPVEPGTMANGMNKPFERPTTPSIRISQGQACFTAQTDTHLQHTLLKTIMEVMMDHQAMSGMDLQAPMELKCLK